MLSTLALCLVMTGGSGIDPPGPLSPGFWPGPWRDFEEYRVDQLELARSRRAGREEMNEMYQDHILFISQHRSFTPEERARLQNKLSRMLDKGRVKVEFLRRYERELELWGEQRKRNPGSETDRVALNRIGKLLKEEAAWDKAWEAGRIAPMPREAKTKK